MFLTDDTFPGYFMPPDMKFRMPFQALERREEGKEGNEILVPTQKCH